MLEGGHQKKLGIDVLGSLVELGFGLLGSIIPTRVAIWFTKFLKRTTNSGKAVIKGKRVNRGGLYGLEVPCEYHFIGDAFSISWLKQKLQNEGYDVG